MANIILHLIRLIQYQQRQIKWLLEFICKFIPLKQWMFDDSHSPKYQKFKVDQLPLFANRRSGKWDFDFLQEYYLWRYGKKVAPIRRRVKSEVPDDCKCPCCGAPSSYIYRNNGKEGQMKCKVCSTVFNPVNNEFTATHVLRCPHCGHALEQKKSRKFFRIHKCINPKCPYYLHNLKKVDPEHLREQFGKNKYKLHYLYREFTVDFFKMDLSTLPKNASSLKFRKHDAYVMSLCLTLHINLSLSLRRTSQALRDLYGINISHQQIFNYARTAAIVLKPFVDNYDYEPSDTLVADETYVKVRGVKSFVWFVMDSISRSILGYRLSDNRSVGPCILAMRQALKYFKKLPETFRFIADGYSAYPLAAQQFLLQFGNDFKFDVTQVIGLTNDDAVSKAFRSFKQQIERLNRTFKATYRVSSGYDNYPSASNNIVLWVAYYNFLRPHAAKRYKVLNNIEELNAADTMPGKWQLLIKLSQQTILRMQEEKQGC